MKKLYLSVVLTMTCLLGLGEGARALDTGKVVSNVPFEFVAGGATLPAGLYTAGGVSPDAFPSYILVRSNDKGALLLPLAFDGTPTVHGAPTGSGAFEFARVGDRYFLSRIETPAGVYTFATPRAITKVAQMKDHGTLTSSGGAN